MKKYLILTALVIVQALTSMAYSQGRYLDIPTFRQLTNDMTARITAPLEDQNGEICALIKVTANIDVTSLTFEPDGLGFQKIEQHPGELWIYLPNGSRYISAMHNDYSPYRNYRYPCNIESGNVYEMKIYAYKENDSTAVSSNSQMLVLRVEPAENSKLYIDNAEVPLKDGMFSAMMQKGVHTYMAESPMYEPSEGDIQLEEKEVTRTVNLRPQFGHLNIYSLPEADAKVFVNDKEVGVTPYKSDRLKAGTYNIRLEKEFFFPKDTSVVIFAGSTNEQTISMVSTIKPKEPRMTLIMAEAAFHPAQTCFGVMVGLVRKNGGYVRGRTDFGSVSTDMECNDKGELTSGGSGTPYYVEGSTSKSRLSITGGYLRQITSQFYGYVGGGYGDRTLAWETTDGKYAKNTDHSASGIALEAGGIGRFGNFAVSLGVQTISFKYTEASLGVGVFF